MTEDSLLWRKAPDYTVLCPLFSVL